jgi:diguanylate cyclase (GGDEF)-like protein
VASHDALTELPNRLMLYEFASHMMGTARRSGGKMAVLFFDLDRFKAINDTYGHKIGDRVLQEAARRIVRCLRVEDLVGRLGGDEFVAVIAEIAEPADVIPAAAHCLDALGRPYLIDQLELQAPSSIGISLFPDDGDALETLIQNADMAMYQAKRSGGGNYQFFGPDLDAASRSQSDLATRMKKDLITHAFQLVYQPIFDSATNAVVAVEALIRWPGMNLGPIDFIPIAEASGLIQAMGEWAIKEACSQLQEWVREGLPLVPLAINVSPKQFFETGFSRGVARAVAAGGVAPQCVHLEIPEAAVIDNFDEAVAILDELRQRGIKTEMDEFGHGELSLEQMSHLPIDTLKVNVQNLGSDQIGTILGRGRNLGLDIIAERIESADALDYLREQKCGKLQGYHLCRPMRGAVFADWYKHRATA